MQPAPVPTNSIQKKFQPPIIPPNYSVFESTQHVPIKLTYLTPLYSNVPVRISNGNVVVLGEMVLNGLKIDMHTLKTAVLYYIIIIVMFEYKIKINRITFWEPFVILYQIHTYNTIYSE